MAGRKWDNYNDSNGKMCINYGSTVGRKKYDVPFYDDNKKILEDTTGKKIISDCESNPNCKVWEYTSSNLPFLGKMASLSTSETLLDKCFPFSTVFGTQHILGAQMLSSEPNPPLPPNPPVPPPNPPKPPPNGPLIPIRKLPPPVPPPSKPDGFGKWLSDNKWILIGVGSGLLVFIMIIIIIVMLTRKSDSSYPEMQYAQY